MLLMIFLQSKIGFVFVAGVTFLFFVNLMFLLSLMEIILTSPVRMVCYEEGNLIESSVTLLLLGALCFKLNAIVACYIPSFW